MAHSGQVHILAVFISLQKDSFETSRSQYGYFKRPIVASKYI